MLSVKNQKSGVIRRDPLPAARRTDHALLLPNNLTKVFEDLIELGNALLDLFDFPLALLDKLFLKLHLGVGDLWPSLLSTRALRRVSVPSNPLCAVSRQRTVRQAAPRTKGRSAP